MKLGVALSGGGIKSFSQIPILRVLEDEGQSPTYISGTSMGAAIAALIACGVSAHDLEALALEIEEHLISTRLFTRPSSKILPFSKEKIKGGYVDGQVLEDIFNDILEKYGIKHISDVKIPLAMPAVDLKTGKTIVFVSHPEIFNSNPNWIVESDISLAKAVRASCSFPLVIAACEYKSYFLADGGIRMNLPSQLMHAYGADKVLGVTMNTGEGFEDMDSVMAIGNRVYDLMVTTYDEFLEPSIDLTINVPIGDIWVFELGKGKLVLEKGQEVADASINDIRKLKEPVGRFKRLFKKKEK